MECPNCITPRKCNGPHLEKSWEGLYNSTDGYFMINKITKLSDLDQELGLE
jgi:hypothetical protein